MLRSIFGEQPRQEIGLLLETNTAIDAFCNQLRREHNCAGGVKAKWVRLDLWATGLRSALNELEQSVYCSQQYGANITKLSEEEMTSEELTTYYRYMYYYKNAFIRIFSILDKTGYFLDKFYDLETARVKPKFSYYTVLRQLHKLPAHTSLEQRLFDIKVIHQKPMQRLKTRRNLEIHSLNAELIDDVWRMRQCFATEHSVEPVHSNLEDLQQGLTMVCDSLHTIFAYCSKPSHG
ncbi:MAG: Cthe_2314 family HEPN domain-containing protein [Paenibacillaceae bacterium]